ncbi:hypothetical protein Tco_0584960 [Tanacetum coccineum]
MLRMFFSSTNTPDYTLPSPDYSPALSGNTSPDSLEDPFEDHSASLTISPFHDDPYIKVMQAYNPTSNESPIPLPRAPIAPTTILPPSTVISTLEMLIEDIQIHHRSDMKSLLDTIHELKNHKGGPPNYTFDESIFTELDNSLWIIPRHTATTGKTSSSTALAMTQATIKKLVADSVAAALEA